MRILLTILSLTILLTACRSKNKLPGNVLPQQKMKLVMWDMMRADQFLSDYVFSRDTAVNHYLESVKWYGQILAIHQVSQEEFKRSFTYYNEHPEQMKTLMDSIAVYQDTTGIIKPRAVTDTIKPKARPSE